MAQRHYKLVLIGDSAVGKTTLISKYTGSNISGRHIPTVGAGYYTTEVGVEGDMIPFDVWDTAGQELYHALVPHYARGAHSAIIVFDVTDISSFENLGAWVDFIREQPSEMVTMLFGNKTDLKGDRKISSQKAKQFADENGLMYMEGSALKGEGVEDCFSALASQTHSVFKLQNSVPSIPKEKTKDGDSYCC